MTVAALPAAQRRFSSPPTALEQEGDVLTVRIGFYLQRRGRGLSF